MPSVIPESVNAVPVGMPTSVQLDVSATAARYTRYCATPAAPAMPSSFAVTALHVTSTVPAPDAALAATVSGSFGATVSAPAAVSTMPRR